MRDEGVDGRVAFIGGGNMATALIRGLTESGWEARRIVVAEPDGAKCGELERRFGVTATVSNGEAVGCAALIVIAVKPQIIDDVLCDLASRVDDRHLIVSIAAGVTLARLEKLLGRVARIVRVMPNTPSLIGRGAAVLCAGRNATKADVERVCQMFETVGRAHVVGDESMMDAVTALSGSGPAYVYRFAEALIDAGVACGLPTDLATDLVLQTIVGAAEMMLLADETPATLRTAVSSPGGTTLAGLATLDEGGFVGLVGAAVAAAARRSRELGHG